MNRATFPELTVPRHPPRHQRSEATVEALLEATRELLRQGGYDAATIPRIAVKAGVSVSSVYQYFPNKEALVGAIVEQNIAGLRDVVAGALAEALELPADQAARLIVNALFEACRDEELNRELVTLFPVVEKLAFAVQTRRELAQRVGEWLAWREDLGISDPHIVGQVIVNAVYGALEGGVTNEPGLIKNPRYSDATAELVARFFTGARKE
jgi:AcrR family transcriptional regulator